MNMNTNLISDKLHAYCLEIRRKFVQCSQITSYAASGVSKFILFTFYILAATHSLFVYGAAYGSMPCGACVRSCDGGMYSESERLTSSEWFVARVVVIMNGCWIQLNEKYRSENQIKMRSKKEE